MNSGFQDLNRAEMPAKQGKTQQEQNWSDGLKFGEDDYKTG